MFRPNAVPQAQADEFTTGLEAEKLRVYISPMPQHKSTQHLDLLCFAG